jgi:glycosyltransferase involved in cell wall biosynthesis
MRGNIGGYKWLWYDGYGRFTLGFAEALNRLGHQFYPFEIEALDKPAWFQRAAGLDFSVATVMITPPHEMRDIPGRNFCFTMHESTRLPDHWAEHINNKSQWCLVPSPWLIPVMEEAGVKVPIEVVPGGIDPDECKISHPNPHRPFTFGCLADRGNRKGYDKVWTAFYRAFDHRNREVRLLTKCRPGSLPNLDFSYSTDDRLTIWKADVDHVADVYSQMDCFVFPSRCEGYGMPPREASACGVPTIVTRWSGTADDADAWAIPLDNFTLRDSGMKGCGGDWAEPSLDEICEKMLWVYGHQDEARSRAIRAAKWLRDNQTYEMAAQKLVKVMGKHLGGPPPAEEVHHPLTSGTVVHTNGKHKEAVTL